MPIDLPQARRLLRKHADPAAAKVLQRFFKTGKGEYGEGDRFLGTGVPAVRSVARQCDTLPLGDVRRLLASLLHEERLLALLILIRQYDRADAPTQELLYRQYLASTRHINNWDLVDISAPNIVGKHLLTKSHRPLLALARSGNLWERRIAMMATHHFIREGKPDTALRVAKLLLTDDHDLIHKAVGWMLREVGKRNPNLLKRFLRKHIRKIPRTALRYAIERFPERDRQRYLEMTIPRRSRLRLVLPFRRRSSP